MKARILLAVAILTMSASIPASANSRGEPGGDHYWMNPCTYCESVNKTPAEFLWCNIYEFFKHNLGFHFKCKAACNVMFKCGAP